MDAWDDDQLKEDVDALIDAWTKKRNNITRKRYNRKNISAGNHEDESESKFMASLAKILLTVIATAAQQKQTNPENIKLFNKCKQPHTKFKNVDPARFAHA